MTQQQQDIVGKCLDGRKLADFYHRHSSEFAAGSGKLPSGFVESLLPGQQNLPINHPAFPDYQSAFIALEISSKWVGTSKKTVYRMMYIHPNLIPLLLQELGAYLYDRPIGENEMVAPEPPEFEEEEDEEE